MKMLEVKITLDRENKTRSFVFIVYNILLWQKCQQVMQKELQIITVK